jgi:putative ABC transport system permease protein
MLTFRKLWRRVRALVAGQRLDRELDEELGFHLEMEAAKLRQSGLDPAAARRRARVEFGPVQRFREETRDVRGLNRLDDLIRDLRHGARALARRPGFTAVVLLTLGVGVGGSAAIYGAVDGILLTPLPYPDAERVMAVWQHDRKNGIERQEVAPANFLDWRERSRSFGALAAMEPFGLDWRRPEGPLYLPTWLVYERFFEVLGTAPLLGRTFRPDEHVSGRGDVVVLGFGIWRAHFAGDRGIVGRVLTLDGKPTTVVGVMPEGFALPSDDVVWAPKVLAGWESQSRRANFYSVVGRLRDGVTLAQARAELGAIAGQLESEHPPTNADIGVTLVPLPEQIVGGARGALYLLLGAVGLVLAVVVANIASLQLARAASREREFAVRSALGAGRGRVTRLLAAESFVLAALGTGLGFGLARLALAGIRALAPAGLPRVAELQADAQVLGFAALVSALVTLSTGALPAMLASGTRLLTSLAEGGRGSTSGRLVSRVQGALVVLQVGLSLVLLIGAGLLVKSFVSLLGEERGFRTEGVVTLTTQSWGYYPQPADRVNFVREVTERLARAPGVRAAGMASAVPLMETIGAEQAPLAVEGAPPLAAGETPPMASYAAVSGELFEALGIPLRRGRIFDSRDRADALRVALVNEAFARRYFPGQDPIGKRIAVGRTQNGPPPWLEIVGVVGDVRRSALHEEAAPAVYFHHPQSPTGANAFVVWGDGRPAQLLERTKGVVWEVNPDIPVNHEFAMSELVGASVRDRSFLLAILGGFAAMALGLAAAGIFGLMSYATGQRTREIGLRMAFGAERGQVLGLVLRRGAALAGLGIATGLASALGVTRLLEAMLYRVTPFDPVTFATGAAVLLGTALVATWYPARRAASIDPITALRED